MCRLISSDLGLLIPLIMTLKSLDYRCSWRVLNMCNRACELINFYEKPQSVSLRGIFE